MFGLTPRDQKAPPLLTKSKVDGDDKNTNVDDQPTFEQLHLAQALEIVLAKKSDPQSHNDPISKPTADIGHVDKDSPGFLWVTSAADADESQSTSKISKRWLKRAQRERRWGRLRRGVQWIVLLCGACAVIALALWPTFTP